MVWAVAGALAGAWLGPAAAEAAGPRAEVLELARRAWDCARRQGEVEGSLLTVIDYSLPSTAKRLWVLDMRTRRVLFHELVAHGEGSGDIEAVSFSNRPGSRSSSGTTRSRRRRGRSRPRRSRPRPAASPRGGHRARA